MDEGRPEAERAWLRRAYKLAVVRPLNFFGAFALAKVVIIRERWDGEGPLVEEVVQSVDWTAEDLEEYRRELAARGEEGAQARVERLQAYLKEAKQVH